ncbi:MAG: hypothetical protein LBS01_00520 [Prevotellaceae bacterium]|jgi:hypothetical protein|nr:hypothetical protein [Prevotellaceae bacterium]
MNKFLKPFFLINAVAFLMITFISCNKDENVVLDDTIVTVNPDDLFAKSEFNLNMRDFALAVNEVYAQNQSFRKIIKEEALAMVDDAFDVLLTRVVNKPVTVSEIEKAKSPYLKSVAHTATVKDLLENAFQSSDKAIAIKSRLSKAKSVNINASVIDSLNKQYPDLQISIPVNIDKVDENSDEPLVVTFVPEEFIDNKTQYLTAYKGDQVFAIDAINPPDYAVLVINMNERNLANAVEIVPIAPSNLTGTCTNGGISLQWTWTNGTSRPSREVSPVSYKVWKAIENSAYVAIAARTVLHYVDVNIETGVNNFYYVTAVFADGQESESSNIIRVTGCDRPNPPKTFNAVQRSLNSVELDWTLENNFSGTSELNKQLIGSREYSLVGSFPSTGDKSYFDNTVSGGQKLRYKLENRNVNGTSNALYDMVYVTYRDPSKVSNVYIHKIHSNGDSESWPNGPPEYRIKVLNVNSAKQTFELQPNIICDFSGTTLFGWDRTQTFNKFVIPWDSGENGFWYDMLTFYVMEQDVDGDWLETEFTAKYNYKDSIAGTVPSEYGGSVKLKFADTSDEVIGNAYLSYYQEPTATIHYPNDDCWISFKE